MHYFLNTCGMALTRSLCFVLFSHNFLVIPSAFPTEWDPLQPLSGFRCDHWLLHPETTGPDYFSSEEPAR
jgi:hypothetical protein